MLSNIYFKAEYNIYMCFCFLGQMSIRDRLVFRSKKPMVRAGYKHRLYREGSPDLYYAHLDEERVQPPLRINLVYGGNYYFAYAHCIFSTVSDRSTVILLTKAPNSLTYAELRALRREDPDRLELVADMFLRLDDGVQFRLRMKGKTLTALTEEQEGILGRIKK